MSIESKLAKLSIGDEVAIVEAIRADGVEKSGFASNIGAIAARIASSNPDEAIAALKTVIAVANDAPTAEAFNKECLTQCTFFFHSRKYVSYSISGYDVHVLTSLFASSLYRFGGRGF